VCEAERGRLGGVAAAEPGGALCQATVQPPLGLLPPQPGGLPAGVSKAGGQEGSEGAAHLRALAAGGGGGVTGGGRGVWPGGGPCGGGDEGRILPVLRFGQQSRRKAVPAVPRDEVFGVEKVFCSVIFPLLHFVICWSNVSSNGSLSAGVRLLVNGGL